MTLRRVEIRWIDAEVDGGWQSVSDVEKWDAPWVRSLGFVMHEPTDQRPWWILAGEFSGRNEDRQVNRPIVIPAGMVKRVEWLD